MGIHFELNCEVGKDVFGFAFEQYDAVFVVGTYRSMKAGFYLMKMAGRL